MVKHDTIKDSGSMQEFESGSRRDDATGKGDCSLLPMKYVSMVMKHDPVIGLIDEFMEKREVSYLVDALRRSIDTVPQFRYMEILSNMRDSDIDMNKYESNEEREMACFAHMMLEVSKQYEIGGQKYGRNNWMLSMPVNRYISSGVRHYLKTLRGDIDEPHYRGFVWNLLCAMWTAEHFPEMNYKEEPQR